MNNPLPDNPPPLPVAPPPDRVEPAAIPLSPEQRRAITLAQQRARKIRSAAWMAMFNGVWLWVFSGLSLLIVAIEGMCGEFDVVGAIMGVGLGAIAWNEFRGRKLLLQYQARATVILGWNQLALLALIVGYASWMIVSSMYAGNPFEDTIQSIPQSRKMLGGLSRLYETLTLLLYGGLIAGSVICQGANSLYYFTRVKFLRAYLAETPDWVVELQRRQAGGKAL